MAIPITPVSHQGMIARAYLYRSSRLSKPVAPRAKYPRVYDERLWTGLEGLSAGCVWSTTDSGLSESQFQSISFRFPAGSHPLLVPTIADDRRPLDVSPPSAQSTVSQAHSDPAPPPRLTRLSPRAPALTPYIAISRSID
ncbi:hypothetical protein NMY22_g8238 [Coprinellus aureogranulatus]|nr:hypothetical protein NMY22_g8238 [Coprinellus aureogranulatus]